MKRFILAVVLLCGLAVSLPGLVETQSGDGALKVTSFPDQISDATPETISWTNGGYNSSGETVVHGEGQVIVSSPGQLVYLQCKGTRFDSGFSRASWHFLPVLL